MAKPGSRLGVSVESEEFELKIGLAVRQKRGTLDAKLVSLVDQR